MQHACGTLMHAQGRQSIIDVRNPAVYRHPGEKFPVAETNQILVKVTKPVEHAPTNQCRGRLSDTVIYRKIHHDLGERFGWNPLLVREIQRKIVVANVSRVEFADLLRTAWF